MQTNNMPSLPPVEVMPMLHGIDGPLHMMIAGSLDRDMTRSVTSATDTNNVSIEQSLDGPSRWSAALDVMRGENSQARDYAIEGNVGGYSDATTTLYRMSSIRPIVSRGLSNDTVRIAWTYIPIKK